MTIPRRLPVMLPVKPGTADEDRIGALERRVAALEKFAQEVMMSHLADWLDDNAGEVTRCLRTGEPILFPFTGATITAEELRGVMAELSRP